jgi:cephalosporin hydroxylase
MTTVGSYCVVFDTMVEDVGFGMYPDRPWDVGNNPKTAVAEYLRSHPEFEADRRIEDKLLITASPGGYLKRIRR